MTQIQIDGEHLTLEQLYEAVFEAAKCTPAPAARVRMNASRAVVERLIESNAAVYGVNTGFGKMASVRISREQIGQLQLNLVRSHCLRRWRAAHRARDARHARLARQCHCERIFRRAAGCRRNALRHAESRRASGDSIAGLRGRVGRSRSARASCASGDRRRRSRSIKAARCRAATPCERQDRAARARSERRPRASRMELKPCSRS